MKLLVNITILLVLMKTQIEQKKMSLISFMKKTFFVLSLLLLFFTRPLYAQNSVQNIQEEKAEAV